MLVTLASWIYIGFFCLFAGIVARQILGHFFAMEERPGHVSSVATMVYGIVGITVYAEIFSIFYRVGTLCHLILLSFVIVFVCCSHVAKEWLRSFYERGRKILFSWKGILLLLFILIAAFYTSRGEFHYDTGMYHAQAIRIIEDYGVVKGIANLQLHFGYNSSYLVFCAFFTMRWLTGTALHTTTGFLIVLTGCYAIHGLMGIRNHTYHGADGMRVALLLYILTNLTGAMSPATDYGTQYLLLYLFCAFLDTAEERNDAHDLQTENSEIMLLTQYGMIAMLGLFLVSMKLSAAAVFLLALYPLIRFLQKRQWKKVASFIVLGVVLMLPYLIRNVILSGWLFYPFEAIDLFQVEWKVPVEYSLVDSQQIKVWGRCLYDIDLIDTPFSEWIFVWWDEQTYCAKMLVLANVLSVFLLIVDFLMERTTHKMSLQGNSQGRGQNHHGIRWDLVNFIVMLFAGILVWLFSSPFIRYGLAFLLALPCLALGWFVDEVVSLCQEKLFNFGKCCGVCLSLLVVLSFSPWIDEYFTDDLVFIRQYGSEPYYFMPKPFDDSDMGEEQMGDETVYYSYDGIVNSYYVTPSTCYKFMLDRTELIGDTIQEGFKAKEE